MTVVVRAGQPRSADFELNLRELALAFAEAEVRLKRTEITSRKTPSAVINELRYAGCHLLRAVCPAVLVPDEAEEDQDHDSVHSSNTSDTEVRRAIDHCKRAKYDAIEFDTIVCLERCDEFIEEYRQIIADDIPGLPEALRGARSAQATILEARNDNSRRGEYLDELDKNCAVVLRAYDALDALRPILNAKRERLAENNLKAELDKANTATVEARSKAHAYRMWLVGIVVAVIAAAAALATTAAHWTRLIRENVTQNPTGGHDEHDSLPPSAPPSPSPTPASPPAPPPLQ